MHPDLYRLEANTCLVPTSQHTIGVVALNKVGSSSPTVAVAVVHAEFVQSQALIPVPVDWRTGASCHWIAQVTVHGRNDTKATG
jgi:hypothetical protein